MKIPYRTKKISVDRLAMIEQANQILEEYAEQGFDLTLRQLYYQFVARDAFPDDRCWRWTGSRWVRDPNGTKNADPNYKWLGDIVDDGRMCGLIDWDRIEDRTRNLRRLSSWKRPEDMVQSAFEAYHKDRWATQPCRVELWCEKEALIGIFARVCDQWDVPYFACRGYVSQSEMWRAAQRLRGYRRRGQVPIILHFGDHDPSGIDMTRDIRDRLEIFGVRMDVRRLALNMDQVDEFKPPPNPAKLTDARARGYIERFGDESWELDALDPVTLSDLVASAVHRVRDADKWRKTVNSEISDRATFKVLRDRWGTMWSHIHVGHKDLVESAQKKLRGQRAYKTELQAKGHGKKMQIFEDDEPASTCEQCASSCDECPEVGTSDDDFEDCESCGASTLKVELSRNEKKTGDRVCDPCAEDSEEG